MRTFRAYFNRHREAPQVWSIDEGSQDSEINVRSFVTSQGCTVRSKYNGKPSNENTPSAWIEVEAIAYTIHEGICYFLAGDYNGDYAPTQ
jgi:hypothetical protein